MKLQAILYSCFEWADNDRGHFGHLSWPPLHSFRDLYGTPLRSFLRGAYSLLMERRASVVENSGIGDVWANAILTVSCSRRMQSNGPKIDSLWSPRGAKTWQNPEEELEITVRKLESQTKRDGMTLEWSTELNDELTSNKVKIVFWPKSMAE